MRQRLYSGLNRGMPKAHNEANEEYWEAVYGHQKFDI